ncbi:YhgE/Pip family protein [Paenibacillus sp. MWE-103]|uniref:YhgE/Pip family protein n=1 Tax=Paenibacillus artemisiicola TaxID=1172618 RepID=A0ABS3WGI0_9BACL|nr:YhgE/Pip family protein [Paenibacillus artemisiicola]
MYLWAFWDPTAHVERLRLAIVNEDAGTSRGGGERNLGRELTAKLIADRSTDWRPASRAEAERGVKDLAYAMALYLPADFSERAFSVSGDRPEPTSMRIELNEGANLLNAKIVRSVADSVRRRTEPRSCRPPRSRRARARRSCRRVSRTAEAAWRSCRKGLARSRAARTSWRTDS